MNKKTKKNEICCVDLFCGIGGLANGLLQSGIKVVAGLDIDTNSKFPYEVNNKADFLERDVSDISPDELKDLFPEGSMRLLAGCAPCQPFSTYSQNSRKEKVDERWNLLHKFGFLVQEVQPEFVTMENVPQLLKHQVFQDFLGMLEGYSIAYGVVECENYDVPQTRRRLALIASRISEVSFEDIKNQASKKCKSVKEAIGHLPKIKAGENLADDPIHTSPRLSSLNLERIKASRPGGTWRDWDEHLKAECHKKKSGETYPSVYGRMEWSKPSPTITTQCFGYGNGRFGHPEQDRAISLREAAILQSFPDSYIFTKPNETPRFNVIGKLIGNAVPVRIGFIVGKAIKASLEKIVSPSLGQLS